MEKTLTEIINTDCFYKLIKKYTEINKKYDTNIVEMVLPNSFFQDQAIQNCNFYIVRKMDHVNQVFFYTYNKINDEFILEKEKYMTDPEVLELGKKYCL